MSEIKFVATKIEREKILKIVKRAAEIAKKAGVKNYNALDASMDLEAVHCNGTPLRLGDLAIADDFNLAHDVFGIARHLDRSTGKLLDCFVPRFHQPRTTDVTTAGLRTAYFRKRGDA